MADMDAVLRDLRRKNQLISTLQDRIARLDDTVRAQQGAVREAQRREAEARQAVEQRDAKAAAYRRKYHEAVQTMRAQQAALEAMEVQLQQLGQQNETLLRKYQRSKAQRASLAEQLQQQDAHLQDVSQHRQQTESEVHTLRRQVQEMQSSMQAKTDLVASLETTLHTMENELRERDRALRHMRRQTKQRSSAVLDLPGASASPLPRAGTHRPLSIPSHLLEMSIDESSFHQPSEPSERTYHRSQHDYLQPLRSSSRSPAAGAAYKTNGFSRPAASTPFSSATAYGTTRQQQYSHHVSPPAQRRRATPGHDVASLEAVLDEHIERFERGLNLGQT